MTPQADNSSVFAALGNPVRLKMTEQLLRHGPLAMSALGKSFAMTLTGTRKHIQVLESAGLVTCAKTGRENICSVNPATLKSAAGWFERQEKFWNASFDRLEKILQGKPS